MTYRILAAVVIVAALPAPTPAADAGQPHEHQGVLAPYEAGPLNIELSEDDRATLAAGKLVIITIETGDSGGRGIAIQDVHAPPDTVWSRIMGFERYPEWIVPVRETEVYRRQGRDIFTRIKVAGFLYKYEYFIRNTWWPDQQMLTWTLDYSRRSDFDDTVGAWFVEPHPDRKGWSRIWFSSDLKLRIKLPGFLMNFIKKEGLRSATEWVKIHSEAAVHGLADEHNPIFNH